MFNSILLWIKYLYNKDNNIFSVPKILTEIKKKQMVESFKNGMPLDDISTEFGLKKATIIKHLKSSLGLIEYKKIDKNLSISKNIIEQTEPNLKTLEIDFIEISPLQQPFDFEDRKDLTTEPLEKFCFPENIYMIINSNTELEIKLIRDFPEYEFLPDKDQNRKVIKLFADKKLAKSFISKNNKLIKIPNGKIIQLASRFLIDKGITRIIFENNLLSV